MRAGRLDLAGVAALRAALTDAAEEARFESKIVAIPDSECWWWAAAAVDFTFSVPRSVSVLWGVADAGTQALIVEAHHEAVAQVVAFLEREVAVTRAGSNARNGAVARHEVLGIVAAAYDHWDSRAGDPQLHTHVVIATSNERDEKRHPLEQQCVVDTRDHRFVSGVDQHGD